ncbi:MAG: hypothetical protein ISS82_06310 [Nanoarchaeota archaeon]|nr:hypothetical protein [Nanoarchaeota archaeon]
MEMWGDKKLKEYEQEYEKLKEKVEREIGDLTVGDVQPYPIKKIVQKVLKARDAYNKKVPEEFREDDYIEGLEKRILNLQEDFIKD